MCDALPDCFGIHKYIGISKGFLLKKPCMLEALEGLDDSTVFDYYAKMDPESAGGEGCPMGMAVLADNFKDLAGGLCRRLRRRPLRRRPSRPLAPTRRAKTKCKRRTGSSGSKGRRSTWRSARAPSHGLPP